MNRVLLLALALWLVPRPADACSCGSGPARFLPGPLARLPQNARGIVFWTHGFPWLIDAGGQNVSASPPPPASEFSLRSLDAPETNLAVRVEPLVEPAPWGEQGRAAYGVLVLAEQPLKPGRYRFEGPDRSAATLTVDATPLSPGKAFALELSDEKHGPLRIGVGVSCSATVGAVWRTVEAKLPAVVRPYSSAVLVNTRVDGKLWRPSDNFCSPTPPGRSWKGTGKETLFAVCSGPSQDEGLSPGKHRVEMEVVVPGAGTIFRSVATELTLSCPQLPPKRAADTTAEPPGGCGACQASSSSAPSAAWLLLAVAGLRRRRRVVRGPQSDRARLRSWRLRLSRLFLDQSAAPSPAKGPSSPKSFVPQQRSHWPSTSAQL